jgi:predicted nucleotidyltransferase
MKTAPDTAIVRDLAFLADHPDLLMAVVFGSTADGRAGCDSDVDVAIYPRIPLDHCSLQDLSDQIAMATGRTVDLVDLSTTHGGLLRQILRNGRVIFSKRLGILGSLHERLLDWQEDFEPAIKAMLATRMKRFTSPVHGH